MEADTLEYWEKIKADREEDLQLEIERNEDDQLIRLLKIGLAEANAKIEELQNG